MSVEYSTFGEILIYFIRLQLFGDYGGGVGGAYALVRLVIFERKAIPDFISGMALFAF